MGGWVISAGIAAAACRASSRARSVRSVSVIGKWQATVWPVASSRRSGSSLAQSSWAFQQRVRKRQPEGGSMGLGTSPVSRMRVRWAACAAVGVGDGDGGEQGEGVGVQGVEVEVVAGADFDDFAEVHDGDAVGDVPHDGQVVGDEQVGEVEFALQVVEEVDDLGLDGDVEGGDGFVGDDQFRAQGQGAGDADALALAAGEFVGVAVVVLGAEADQFEQVVGLRVWRPWGVLMPWTWIGAAMIEPTVWRGLSDEYGSWKIIWTSRRSRAHLPDRQVGDVAAFEDDLPAGGFQQPGDQPPGGRLAAAGLADQPQRLPGTHRGRRSRPPPAPHRPCA